MCRMDAMRTPSIKRTIPVRTGVAIAVVIAVITLAAVTVAGSSPSACASCHATRADALAQSLHAGVSCYSCHLAAGGWSLAGFKARELFVMYPRALVDKTETGPVVHTSSAACLGCHSDVRDPATGVVERNGLRISHSSCAAELPTCDVCHATVAHGESARGAVGLSMDLCTACHVQQGATLECDSCHTARRTQDVELATPFSVTHGPNWHTTHGLGELDLCQTCHAPDSCVKCHGLVVPHEADFGSTHGMEYLANTDSCVTCHHVETFCKDCHAMEMPHPGTFLKEHSKIAEGVDDPMCESCHVMTDCINCHNRHVHPGGALGVPVPQPGTKR